MAVLYIYGENYKNLPIKSQFIHIINIPVQVNAVG